MPEPRQLGPRWATALLHPAGVTLFAFGIGAAIIAALTLAGLNTAAAITAWFWGTAGAGAAFLLALIAVFIHGAIRRPADPTEPR